MQYPTYACAYELDAVTFQLAWMLYQHHLILSFFHDLAGKILPVLFSVPCSLLRTEYNSKKSELRTQNWKLCTMYGEKSAPLTQSLGD